MPGKRIAVLIGDSITHGRIGVNYADIVQKELRGDVEIVNAGVNSELAWNVLQRIDEIIACNPDFVTILIGTNDANGATCSENAEFYVKHMKLPEEPTPEWYRDSLSQIVERLKKETRAKIAVLSIPSIGEVPERPEYLKSKEFASLSKKVADESNVAYLPLFEQMDVSLSVSPSTQSYRFERTYYGMVIAIIKHYSLGRSWDSIADKRGLRFHIDFLHLNTRGAEIAASLISGFIREHL
jgi:lysophospholipase L1-like esterase